jgi:hypothetical protein
MIKIPIEIGDTVYVGRFKNKKIIVKSITYNEYGLPLINGRPLLTLRIEKLMKKESKENIVRNIIREEIKAVLNKGKIKEDIIKVFSLAKPYTKPDASQLRVKADNFIKKLQAKNFTTHTGADVIYFPEYKSLGPCFGVLVGSSTVVIQPIDSDKVFKVGEGLLANVMKSGMVDGYLLRQKI